MGNVVYAELPLVTTDGAGVKVIEYVTLLPSDIEIERLTLGVADQMLDSDGGLRLGAADERLA